MNFKTFNYLLLLLLLLLKIIILRAGLVVSSEINVYNNQNIQQRHKPKPNSTITITSTLTLSSPLSTSLPSKVPPDKCIRFGMLNDCTPEKPYCFVDGDDIYCGHVERIGWRISPLDGLVLNNGQRPNPNCELFISPKRLETSELIMTLLNESEFGSDFNNHESSWFNIFEYLGNCPLKSQFCDKDSLTCENLFGAGKNCSSSNQCFSHYCEKYDKNAPDDTTERRCVEENNTLDSTKTTKIPDKEKNGLLLLIILISILSSILILGIIIWLIRVRRKKYLNENVSNPLISSNSLRSSLLSMIPSLRSSTGKSDSSDNISILLPPPPTLNRNSTLDYGGVFV